MNLPQIESQILPYLIKLAESPPVQAEIEVVKTAIIGIVENQSLGIFQRLVRWIKNKFIKGDDNMSETIINEETTTTAVAEATETISSAVDTASTTASTAASAAVQTTIANVAEVAESGIEELTDKIAELTNEIKTTKSVWVKIRNTIEIGVLSTLLAKAASKIADKL